MIAILRKSRALTATAIAVAGAFVLAAALALLMPSTAFAADKGKVSLEPVNFDGTTYTGTDPKGPFSTAFPKGLSKDDPDSATTALSNKVKQNTDYPWGSVGAKNGSFIQNNTGKPICKFVVTITDTSTFDTAPVVGPKWNAAVSADKKTITFTAVKQPDDCVADGGWFWMQVPKSPQPGSGDTPTLKGSIAALTPDPNGETGVVELTTNDAFVSTLYDVDQAIAAENSPSPTDPSSGAPSSSPTTIGTDTPTDAPSAGGTDTPTDLPSAGPTDSSPVLDTTSPAQLISTVGFGSPGAGQ
jgi:hypothetical protein